MEDPLTSDFIESYVSSLCTGIRGLLHKILTVTVRRSINWRLQTSLSVLEFLHFTCVLSHKEVVSGVYT
ncbi:uncharacterized protein LOC144625248 isoform X4 [Crassostrea virginica]